MPIALDPTQTVDVTLPDDVPPEDPTKQAVFVARYLACLEYRGVQQLMRAAAAEQDPDRQDSLVEQALAIQLVGWRNVVDRSGKPIAFATVEETFDSRKVMRLPTGNLLTEAERQDLVFAALVAVRLAEIDKKKLRWQRASSGETSATTAENGTSASAPAANSPASGVPADASPTAAASSAAAAASS